MKLYITGAALTLLGLVYLPIVLVILVKLWKGLPKKGPIQFAVILLAALILAAVPLGDVLITSITMSQLCPHAGIVINRSVRADGFLTDVGGADYLKRGFQYVEVKTGSTIKVYTASDDGVRLQEFDASIVPFTPRSRYEFVGEITGKKIGFSIDMDKSVGRDRESGEMLGYAIRYVAYPGWVDRNTVGLLGQTIWACPPDSFQESRLLAKLILPAK